MAKLGDFSMSGLTASNLYAGSHLLPGADKSGLSKKDELDELSEISSSMKTQALKHAEPKQEENDPNSLENRLKGIRQNLNMDYVHDQIE